MMAAHWGKPRSVFAYRALRNVWPLCGYQSAFAPENFMTFPHFSVSSAMRFPYSAGERASTVPLRSAKRAFILGSVRAALISLLSLSTISVGVSLGAPMPPQALVSKPGTNSPCDGGWDSRQSGRCPYLQRLGHNAGVP